VSQRLKDRKFGQWLKDKAPDLLSALGDVVPDAGLLDFLAGRLERGGYEMSEADRAELRAHIAAERAQLAEQVTRRWEADTAGDCTLARVVRPLCLLITLVGFFAVLILDSTEGSGFKLDPELASVLEVIGLTIFGAYFAGRSIEKTARRE